MTWGWRGFGLNQSLTITSLYVPGPKTVQQILGKSLEESSKESREEPEVRPGGRSSGPPGLSSGSSLSSLEFPQATLR